MQKLPQNTAKLKPNKNKGNMANYIRTERITCTFEESVRFDQRRRCLLGLQLLEGTGHMSLKPILPGWIKSQAEASCRFTSHHSHPKGGELFFLVGSFLTFCLLGGFSTPVFVFSLQKPFFWFVFPSNSRHPPPFEPAPWVLESWGPS